VLCSLSAIKDLLEKRGEVYADRPTLPILEMCVRPVYIRFIFAISATLAFPEWKWIGYYLIPGRTKFGVKDESF
jgi:hypothetical protein